MSPRTALHLVTLLLGLTLIAGFALPGWAAPQPDDGTDTAVSEDVDEPDDDRAPVSVRLSPAVLEVPVEPGPSSRTLRVENTGSQPLQLITETDEFTVTPEGQTRFVGPDEIGAAGWVEVDADTFELAPGEGRDVEVTVEVPDDAEPGERYVSVIFSVPGTEEGGNIVVTHRVAAKLYIEVPGEQIHHISFGELSGPWLVDSASATFELEVENLGNVHRRFEDPDQLVATSGDHEFLFQNFTILADSNRVVEAVWADPPTVCWCTVEVSTDDGQGSLITATTRVVVFPLRITLALAVLTAGLTMLLLARRRRQARHLKRLLTEVRQHPHQSDVPPAAPAAPTDDQPAQPPPPNSATQPTAPRQLANDSPAAQPTRVGASPPSNDELDYSIFEDHPVPAPAPKSDPQSDTPPGQPLNSRPQLDTSFFTAHGSKPRRSLRRRSS